MTRPLLWFLIAAVTTIFADQLIKETVSRRLATSGPLVDDHYLVVQTPQEAWVPARAVLSGEFTLASATTIDQIARHHTRILGGLPPDPDELLPPGTHLQVMNRKIALWDGVVELKYLENRDASFGLSTKTVGLGLYGLALIGAAIFAACAMMLYWAPRDRAEYPLGLGLVGGGSLANALDRTFRTGVIDYVSVADFPLFNFADVAIVIGGALLIFQLAEWIIWRRFAPAAGLVD